MNFLLPIQIILLLFLLFAVSRVVLRLKDGTISFGVFLFWMGIWTLAIFSVLNPDFTTFMAHFLGIKRGTDAVVYLALAILSYLVFRTNVVVENLRQEISELTRKIALKDLDSRRGKK